MDIRQDRSFKLERWAAGLIVLATAAICLAFFAPFLFTRPALSSLLNFSNSGTVADTVGGLMSPFIALAGVIVTGLAFYMQFKANILLQEQLSTQETQYNVQQFEAQFFEMLKLHKENVNEMDIPFQGRNYKGRSAFKQAVTEIHQIIQNTVQSVIVVNGQRSPNEEETFPYKFQNAYQMFFWGGKSSLKFQHGDTEVSFAVKTSMSRLENDWSAILGHYYRHLYHMVKYVVDSPTIYSYQDKMRYLTILRAQLSNHEQIMLFYNWLAGYGAGWEFLEEGEGQSHDYFTKYRMIHNVWRREVCQKNYILDALKQLDQKSRMLIGKPLLEEDE